MPRIVCTVKADMYHLILGTKGRRSLGASMRDAVARAVEDEDCLLYTSLSRSYMNCPATCVVVAKCYHVFFIP